MPLPEPAAPLPGSEPPPAGADGAARLQVMGQAQQPPSAAQAKFNRLLAQLAALERQLQALQQHSAALRGPHLQHLDALRLRRAQAQRAMACLLHERLQHDGLEPAQQRTARAALRSLLAAAPAPGDDAHWQAMLRLHLPPQPDPVQALWQQLQAAAGQRLELPGLDGIETPEQLLAALQQRQQHEREATAQRRAARQARRSTPAARAAQAQEQDARTALRGIYRQLASALHPDREGEAAERERKQALMSQANTAYARGDLLALLRLQLAAEQVDAAGIARLGEQRLAALALLLQKQVGVLDKELSHAALRLGLELGLPVDARQLQHLPGQLQALQHAQLQEVLQLESGLQRMGDEAGLRRWLREQARLARQPPAPGRPGAPVRPHPWSTAE